MSNLPSGCCKSHRSRVFVVAAVALLSALFAVLFELGTLLGAPISSPGNPADWNPARMGIYFLLALPLSAFLLLNDWRATAARFAAFIEAEDGARIVRWARRVLIGSVILVLVVLVVGVACMMAGNSQPGPYQLFAVCISVVVMAFYAARRKLARRVERVVLVIMLAAGFLFASMVPLYTHASWDDHIHYDRTVAASYLLNPEYSVADQMLVNRSFNDVADYSRYPYSETYHDPYDLHNQQVIYTQLNAEGENDARAVRMEGPTTLREVSITEYYLVAYVPGAVALWFARLLSLPATAGFLLGRLANLFAYAFVVYFAMRRLKSGKLVMAACALIPEAVFLAAGYSYDFWVTSFVMLGFGYFIGELQRPGEPLTWRRLGIMTGAFLIGLGPKAVYVPVAAMLLFMPKEKFAKGSAREGRAREAVRGAGREASPAARANAGEEGASPCVIGEPAAGASASAPYRPRIRLTRAKYVAIMLLSAAFVVATIMVPMFVGGDSYAGDSRGGNVDPAYQIAFILGQPAAFAEIFLDFLKWYVAPEEAHHVLVDFCGVQTSFIDAVLIVLLPLVALLDRRGCDVAYATHVKRICMWALTLVAIVLMAVALFISFTAVDAGRINGMQGRYLIPLLYPLLALGCNLKAAGKRGGRAFGEVDGGPAAAESSPGASSAVGASAAVADGGSFASGAFASGSLADGTFASDAPLAAVASSSAQSAVSASLAARAKGWLAVPANRYALFCYVVLGVCCVVLFLSIYDAVIQQYGRVSGAPMLNLPAWLSPDNWEWLERLSAAIEG